jgi:hypothetical protein
MNLFGKNSKGFMKKEELHMPRMHWGFAPLHPPMQIRLDGAACGG